METNQQQLQAEILARYQVARMSPRDWPSVTKQLVAVCQNPAFARLAYYSVPRLGGSALSTRFAEQAHQLIRNVALDSAPVGQDETTVHYRMTATDLESNTPLGEVFRVKKLAAGDQGVDNEDLRSQMAEIKRRLILSLLPPEVREQCLTLCQQVTRREDSSALAVVTKEVVAAILAVGIDAAGLKAYLGHSPTALSVEEVEELRSIASLIRSGAISLDDWSGLVAEVSRDRKDSPETKKPDKKKPKAQKAPRQTRTNASPGPAGPTQDPPKPPPVSRRDNDADVAAGAPGPAAGLATA